MRTAGWAGSARAAGRRPAGDGGAPKTARRIREAGVAGPPATGRRRGAFSTLLRQSGLRPSTGGVLATKSERKMLASTCFYSLYAWFTFCCNLALELNSRQYQQCHTFDIIKCLLTKACLFCSRMLSMLYYAAAEERKRKRQG